MISTKTMTGRPAEAAGAAPCSNRIEGLARRVERLSVSHRDPEAFFEERAEIVHALRREAARLADEGA